MLHMVKAHYAEAYSQHLLSTQQVRTLQAAADKALDEAGEGLKDWKMLEPSCTLRGLPKLLRAWKVSKGALEGRRSRNAACGDGSSYAPFC
jgi:hypothetical protein